MGKPRILLADDHKIVLEGLRGLLEEQFDLVGFATTGQELLEQAAILRPDVVVADISMPLLNGIEAVRKLVETDKRVKIVFLTMHPDQTYASRALSAGASGYVLKHSASDELVAAIHEVLRGGRFLSESLKTPALDELLDRSRRHVKETIELTPRQREVLQLLVDGKSAKEIGAVLNISPRTVETHKYQMMDELGVKTSAQLVHYAIRHRLAAADQ
jgi:DNA-binding NarL/FixJ family response regulator